VAFSHQLQGNGPIVKSFSCSRQGGEDWRCVADWGTQAKGLAGKKCGSWGIQWKSALSKRDAGQYAGL